jgi:predicted nucleic acid-binding protein
LIFDTDFLIWLQRGNDKAANALDRVRDRSMSIISYMELVRGARDHHERDEIKKFMGRQGLDLIPLTEQVGHRASIYVEQFAKSHGMSITDALIAATAVEHRQPLLTGNARHYRQIRDLELVVFKP